MTTDLVPTSGRVVGSLALVANVAQQVASGVLRPGSAEVHADSPVDPRRVVGTEPVDIDGADSTEAATVHQLLGERFESRL